uniref:Marker of proliferation Ki-67 n=1 Tax=Sarcophilus harrisii TaxID=9305 RepID=A0A7N4V663_SARHA
MTDTLGYVTIIKRTGADGYRYPLNRPSCLFGRSTECDIRLQLPVVSKQQCRIEFNQQLKEAVLINLNSSNPTHLNGTTICHPVKLEHGDLITIFDRSFRFEYECGIQNEGKPPIRPSGPKNKEVMPARSRSISTLDYEPCQRRERHHHSFSDIPTEHTEENNTRPFSLMSYLEEMNADKPKKCDDTSDNVEEHLAGKTPTLHKKEPKKSTTNVTEKSSISIDPAADCSEDVNVSPTFPKKNENHDFSPFKKLFGLMKGELNSNRQQVGHQSYPSSRKSGPKIQISMDDREQKTEPLRSSPSRASPRSQGHLNILNAFGELQEGRSAKEGKPKVLQRSLARGSPGPALELERSHEEERWFEDPYESALEQSQAERFPAERPSQEVERLKAPRKRRSEGLAARNSGRRKEEDRRRSAPLLLPSENPSHPSSLYTLRSQTKRFSSWESGKLPKLGGETAQAPDHMGTPVLKESDFNGGGASPDMPKNKGSLLKNNQITPKKKASSSEEIAKETEKEEFYFEGNVNESDRSAKRRRVSFGVHLRPELFDENLPPNTPLKRGESPGIRRKGGSQPQTVLRKSIIKQEHSKLLEKEPSSHTVEEGVALHAHVQDLSPELPETKKIFACSSISQSCENAESVAGEIQFEKMNKPSSSKSPAAGRRSQHDILQRIYAKRRSGASEANLMVVRSWADVVRLGTRKPQTDVVVKHGLERRIIKKQKRLTPKKPPNSIKDSFGTGHANSPCTIMIGRAHTEKVTVPIRPCRMLNNFVLKTDMDMNEDFTGLADMFKIHINKKRKSETGTAPPLLFEEMSCKEHPPTSSGDEHTSDECAKKLISTTQDAAQELLASSIFSCRRSPRNRQSRGGDNITKIPEMGNDEIIIPGVEDHKILTSSSKRLKTCTPKENEASSPYRNRIKTPENQKIICIEEKLENGSANRATKKFKLSMEQSVDLNFYNPETPNSTLNTLEDSHIIKRLTEMPNKEDSKENSIEKHTNLKNQNKEILDQLGVTPPLKIRSTKEQPVTNQPVEIPKHRRMSLQNQKYSPTEVNKMTSLKPVIVCPDVIPTSKTVTIKHELGDMKKKVTRTPKQKIELVEYEDLSGIRELMTTPRPTAKDKVADFTGDDGKVQKKRRSSVPKQKIELVEDEDLSGIRELMTTPRPTAKDKMTGSSGDDGKVQKNLRSSTPKQKIELVEYDDLSGIRELVTTPRPTAKDKVANFTGNDGKVQEKRRSSILKQKIEVVEEQHLSGIRELMVTPRPIAKDKMTDSSGDDGKVQRKCRSSTPKQKIEVVEDEDLSGIRELMATPRPTVKDKVADFAGDDGKVQRKRRSSTPKQKIEVVEDEDLSGIRELMATPRPTVKDKVADFAGDDGKVQRKRRSSTQKQKIEVVEDEDLSGIRELMATPRPTTKDKVADFAGNDGKVQKNHRGSTQKQKIELVEYDDLSGIRELMTTPRTTAKDKMTGSSGDDGKVQKNLRSSTPKQKIELIEDENLSGILEFMTTPTSTTKDKVVDFAGGDGKVQKNRRGSTQKQEIELVEYEDLSGIRELMTTPRPTTKDKMTDSSGDDGKVQKNLRSSTPKQKIEMVEDEDLSGIRELMTTPRPTAKDKMTDSSGDDGKIQKKRRSSTPKQKLEMVEDEDLSGIRELMTTPRSTKDKVTDFVEDDGKVQKNLTTSKQIVCTDTDAKVQKKLMRSVKQQIEMEDLNDTEQLKKTPKRKCEPAEDLTMVKRLMRSPKDKVEPEEVVVCSERLLRTPKEKAPTVVESLRRLVPPLEENLESLITPKQRVVDLVKDNVNKDVILTKCDSENLSRTRRQSRIAKEKEELIEDVKCVKNSIKTAKQKCDPVEDAIALGTKNLSKTQPIDDNSGLGKLISKPQEGKNVENIAYPKKLMKTPKGKIALLKIPTNKVKPEDLNMTFNERGELTTEDPVNTKKLVRTPKEKEGELMKDLNAIRLTTPKVKGQLDKDLTGVIVFMGTPNKVEDINNAQEISESDSELLQELKMLRKKAIDDFSASNQEPQIIEEILEPAQEVKPQTVGGGRVRNKLPKSRKRVVGDVYKLKTPSRTKDSNVEVDYTGFKEMFESPEESKDYSEEVDQFQLQICTNPFEKDKDKSDPSKTDGSLYSMSLKENVKKDETTQAQQEHDTLPSEIENPFTKKNQKKSLLRFQGEIKDTGGLNQRTLRTRRKTTFDAESKVTSTKIDDEKIVKNITMGRNKKSLDSFLDEVSDKNDSSERTLRSRRNTRFNAESTPASAKMDDGSLEHSEKEEPVKTGSRTFCNAESRRHQTHKEVQSCSSSFSEGEKENSEETVDNLKKRVAGRATSRSRSKNKNAESPNESNVSHTNDEKCSDNKRLTEEKLIQKMAAPPLRFSSRNKTSKELLVSPSSLLSETNRSPREKNEKKKRVTITTRNTSKADIKLQESTGSLVNKIVSSPKEGDEEEKFEKRVGNRGNSVLRSRNRNKSKDMLPCESNISYTDEERENIKNLPEKQKEHKVRVTVSRNSKFLNTCDSLYSSGNNENPMNSCDQGRTDVNEKGIGLRTRSRNKSKEKQESYSIHTECREDNERSLPARSKSISVNEKMASSRTRNRIKNATETQEVNTLPTEVYKPQTEEKSKVASPGKVGKSRSKKKTDLKKSEPIRSSPEKLEPQSKNQDVTETQEVPPLCCVQTEPDQHNASLRSRTRKRLLHSSSVEPEELCLKDEKPVKTQKRLNDTTEDGKLSLKPKRKRKMDTELRDSAEEEKIPVGIRPLTRKRNKVDKELQEIPPVSSANEIAIAEADEEKLSNLGNKLRGKAKENAIAEADEEKLSGLRNKLRGKAKGKTKESFEVEESNGFPLSSATDIAYTLDLSPSGTFSNKRLTNRRGMGSRLKNKSDTNLQTSADVSKTDPSTASMSQTSVIGSKYKHKSDLEQQRSSNLSEDNSSTAASKTILTGSGKAKRGKKVDFTLSTKKRGRAATTSIKTEATAVENFSIPHSPPKSSQVQDNLSAAKGTKSGLKAQSKLKTNQTREKSALSGSEKNYTLRGTRPTTRSSKQK